MCLTHYPGVAQLVGRLVWDQDAASSSLATRTKNKRESFCSPFYFDPRGKETRKTRCKCPVGSDPSAACGR